MRFFEIVVILGAVLLYLSTNQNSLKFVVDTLIKDTNISYTSLSGSLLQSIKVVQPRYKNSIIADSAKISWNLKTLLKNRISFDEINLENLNIATIEAILNKKGAKKEQKRSSLNLNSDIDKLQLSVKPYKNEILNLQYLKISAKDIKYTNKNLFIKEFDINSKTSLFKAQASGSFSKDRLDIESLEVVDVDIKRFEKLLSNLKQNKSEAQIKVPIKKITIKNAKLSTTPYQFKDHTLKRFVLNLNQSETTLTSNPLQVSVNAKKLKIDALSDLAKIELEGAIKNNSILAKSRVVLNHSALAKTIKIINFKNLNPIDLRIFANLDKIDSNITAKTPSLFDGRFKNYKVSINRLFSRLHYDLHSKALKIKSDANLTTPYAKELLVDNILNYDKKRGLHYKGKAISNEFRKFPKKLLLLLKDARADYFGDEKRLFADLNTTAFNLKYDMQNFKSAKFLLHSKELNISKIFDLPDDLKGLKGVVDGKMSLDFHSPKILIDTQIHSNALDAKGVINFKNGFHFKALTKLSKNSILTNIDKKLKLNSIFPSDLNLTIKSQKLTLTNSNKNITTEFFYDLNSTKMDLQSSIYGEKFQLIGDKKRLNFHTKILSLKEAQKSFAYLYDFKPIPLDGEVELNSTIENYEKINANFKSRWIVYEWTKNKFAFAEKVDINLHKNKDELIIDNYKLHAFIASDDRYLFANRPSLIKIGKNEINIDSLWINDELKNSGYYNIANNKAKINSKAHTFHYKGKEGDFVLNIDLQTLYSPKLLSIKGAIKVIKSLVTYRYQKSYEVDDPDIIIIQDQKKDKFTTNSKDHLALDITINSVKPILYKTKDIDIKFIPDLKIWKEPNKRVELLGRVAILKGKYIEQNKEFIILPSELLFGGDFANPYLSIKAKHYANPYDISIDITGRLDSPIINFSSTPFLSQSDILSLLLFDSTSDSLLSGKGNSSNMAISFFGSTFAKEIVKNFGIKLDKLMITTNEEGGLGFEVGKKISKKVTIIYINDIVQTIKVKYQHSDHFETDLTLSPESSGIDFIYKKEH
jgi:translocation and assembly module TamB